MRVSLAGDFIIIQDATKQHLATLRALPGREWKPEYSAWFCPYVFEVWDAIQSAQLPLVGIPRPLTSGYRIDVVNDVTVVVTTLGSTQDIKRCRMIPEGRSFDPRTGTWRCRLGQLNVRYLLQAFPNAQWSATAQPYKTKWGTRPNVSKVQDFNHLLGRARPDVDTSVPTDFTFHLTPFHHQLKAWHLSKDHPAFALFMEQGTGKSLVGYYKGLYLYQAGKISGMIIICPDGMKEPWTEMIHEYTAPGTTKLDIFVWEAKTRHKAEDWVNRLRDPKHPAFRILIMNCESMSSEIGSGIAELFLRRHRTFMLLDESSRFKTATSARTRSVARLGKRAPHRMIMTGTPVTRQTPEDIFSQFKFLDPNIFGKSVTAFRNRYLIMGGWNNREIIGYNDLEDLIQKIDKVSYRVTKLECLDLPPQLFQRREVKLSPEQRAIYQKVRDELLVEFQGVTNIIQYATVQLQFLQRIVGGFVSVDRLVGPDEELERKVERIPGVNPKLAELMEIADELDGEKLIIWAKFRKEIELIRDTLDAKYGKGSTVTYYGGTNRDERNRGRRDFQNNPEGAKFFVGQPQAGGMGLQLTAASTVVYYSNTHNLEDRLQSQDRAHRIGQTKAVTYIDLVAKGTMDVRLIAALRAKKTLADIINGDPSMSWL